MVVLTERTGICCCNRCTGSPQSALHTLCRRIAVATWLPACAAACQAEAQAAVAGAGRSVAAVGVAQGSSSGGRRQGAEAAAGAGRGRRQETHPHHVRLSMQGMELGGRRPACRTLLLPLCTAQAETAAICRPPAQAETVAWWPECNSAPDPMAMSGDHAACRDRETERLQQVLVHPQFAADPVAAVTAHLAATLPPPPPAPKPARKQQPGSRKARQRAARQMDTA